MESIQQRSKWNIHDDSSKNIRSLFKIYVKFLKYVLCLNITHELSRISTLIYQSFSNNDRFEIFINSE